MNTTNLDILSFEKAGELVFKEGFAPNISKNSLLELKKALDKDDKDLLQDITVLEKADFTLGCCAISYCGWKGPLHLQSAYSISSYFAEMCNICDKQFKETFAARFFLTWFDQTERSQMRKTLSLWIAEVLIARTKKALEYQESFEDLYIEKELTQPYEYELV